MIRLCDFYVFYSLWLFIIIALLIMESVGGSKHQDYFRFRFHQLVFVTSSVTHNKFIETFKQLHK